MSLKGCSSFSLFHNLVMLSDLISSTASSMVSSLTQIGLLADTLRQLAAVLLALLSIQSTDSPTAKIPLAPVISTFAFECFHWLAMFCMKFKFLSVFSASICILFIVCILTIQHLLTLPLSLWFSSIYFLHVLPCSWRDVPLISWAVLLALDHPTFTLYSGYFPQEPVNFLLIFCFVDGKNCFIRNVLLPG